MFWIELIIVLAIIFIGVRVGGTFLAMAGGIGMFIMTFILHVTPSDPPITVILIMIAVICAAATMQACGGLDYLVRIAEKILRKNPKMITVLAPVVAYIFTFMCGTGHIVYSLLPVINEIAIETGVRPERPISASIVSSQQAITACPISAATVGILAFMAEATNYTKVNIFTLLIVCVPATLIGTVIAAIAVIKKGKELADDPEFQARVEAGLIEDFSKKVKEEKKVSKEAKISVTIFLIAMVGIVLLGAVSGLVPTLADGSKLPLTTVIEIFMLVAAAAMILLTKLDSNKVLDQPVFRTGMFAKSIMFGDFADGLCVSGAAAGAEPDDVILSRVHEVAKPRKVPVFCNTGCNHGNVREKLGNCDGVCMGTAFKKDGVFNGRVDKERVREFMEIVADIRKGL